MTFSIGELLLFKGYLGHTNYVGRYLLITKLSNKLDYLYVLGLTGRNNKVPSMLFTKMTDIFL